jgi:hypothetical protein
MLRPASDENRVGKQHLISASHPIEGSASSECAIPTNTVTKLAYDIPSFVVRFARYRPLRSRWPHDLATAGTVLAACGEILNSILVDVGCTLVVQAHTLVWVGVAAVATTLVSRVARVRSIPRPQTKSRPIWAEPLAPRDLPTCRSRGRINGPPRARRPAHSVAFVEPTSSAEGQHNFRAAIRRRNYLAGRLGLF